MNTSSAFLPAAPTCLFIPPPPSPRLSVSPRPPRTHLQTAVRPTKACLTPSPSLLPVAFFTLSLPTTPSSPSHLTLRPTAPSLLAFRLALPPTFPPPFLTTPPSPPPDTHTLLLSTLAATGASLTSVSLAPSQTTVTAALHLSSGAVLPARPSDALILARRHGAPLYLERALLERQPVSVASLEADASAGRCHFLDRDPPARPTSEAGMLGVLRDQMGSQARRLSMDRGGARPQGEVGLVTRRMLKDALEAGDAAAAARLRAAILAKERQILRDSGGLGGGGGGGEKALDDWLAAEGFRRDTYISEEEDGKLGVNAEFETEDWREYEGDGLGGEF